MCALFIWYIRQCNRLFRVHSLYGRHIQSKHKLCLHNGLPAMSHWSFQPQHKLINVFSVSPDNVCSSLGLICLWSVSSWLVLSAKINFRRSLSSRQLLSCWHRHSLRMQAVPVPA